jgi:putative transposase
MKKTFTDEQIVKILRSFEASGLTIKDYCRSHNITDQTFYKWRKRFGTHGNPRNSPISSTPTRKCPTQKIVS